MRQATVPKDNIYGFLGILDGSVRARIAVDYDALTDAKVFADAVKLACVVDEED